MTQECATMKQLLSKLAAIQLRFPSAEDQPDAWRPALQAVEAKCLLVIEFGDRHVRHFRESSELYASIFESRKQAMEIRSLCRKAAKTKQPVALAHLLIEIRQAYDDLGSSLRHVCLLMEPQLAPSVDLVMMAV